MYPISLVKDSYLGNLSIWHGNPASVVDSIANDGADPERNMNGWYGKGTYFGLQQSVAEYYAGAAKMKANRPQDNGTIGIIEAKVNIKNPYIISSKDYDKSIAEAFPGSQGNNVDSEAMTAYIRARGYDSIYINDLGYIVTGAKQQVVTVGLQKFKVDSKEFAKIDKDAEKRHASNDDSARDYLSSDIGKALNQKGATDKPNFLKFTNLNEDYI